MVVRPVLAEEFNDRNNVYLVDMKSLPEKPHRYIIYYFDQLTKFHLLQYSRTKTDAEVIVNLFEIFIDIEAPQILYTDNGRIFTAKVIQVKNLHQKDC